jgi:hypothetical protein
MIACGDAPETGNPDGNNNFVNTKIPEENIKRAMALLDTAYANHFTDRGIVDNYNPHIGVLEEKITSIWGYTSAIEAVNAILAGLKAHKESGNAALYDENHSRYVRLLDELYDNIDYYKAPFSLVSYTRKNTWTVYAVDRGTQKGKAPNAGGNVYDDHQWLLREMLESYKLTNEKVYLDEAEYIAEYILDGWDCTLDEFGQENGGIVWGPGYVTKHACSNGPAISPLVWLGKIYEGKDDEITNRYIAPDGSRKTSQMKKSEYYLMYAKKIYDWQKKHLTHPGGVFYDMLGLAISNPTDADFKVQYEWVDGVQYRKNTKLGTGGGAPRTYNTGSMLSAAVDLYSHTQELKYLNDTRSFADASFSYFAVFGDKVSQYYSFPIAGYSTWFNGVLMRAYVEAYPAYNDASGYVNPFQKNLDYAYEKFLYKGVLPTDLLLGWNADNAENNTLAMFSFTYSGEYAVLARYQLERLSQK